MDSLSFNVNAFRKISSSSCLFVFQTIEKIFEVGISILLIPYAVRDNFSSFKRLSWIGDLFTKTII